MKIIMVAVVSRDGFLTRGDDPVPTSWSSEEDKQHYKKLVHSNNLHVMGKTTYLNYKFKPGPDILRVVLTSDPDAFISKKIPNQVEFHNLSPTELVTKYEHSYDSCLLVGGASIFTQYLEHQLVDEIYLTVEPVKNVTGIRLFEDAEQEKQFLAPFDSQENIINEKGTILRHYTKNDADES